MITRDAFEQIVDTLKYKDKYNFKIFNDSFVDENEAIIKLEEFEALFLMRERTPLTKTL